MIYTAYCYIRYTSALSRGHYVVAVVAATLLLLFHSRLTNALINFMCVCLFLVDNGEKLLK